MGQKINPILFRQGKILQSESSLWHVEKSKYSHFFIHDYEIRNFIENLLKNRGIILRSFKLVRSYDKVYIVLDLYFSYLLTKRVKFFWAKSLLKSVKEKYDEINRMKDIKTFIHTMGAFDSEEKKVKPQSKISLVLNQNKKNRRRFDKKNRYRFNLKFFLRRLRFKRFFKVKRKIPKSVVLHLKTSFYFFLLIKKNKRCFFNAKESSIYLGAIQNYRRKYLLRPNLIKMTSLKFKKLFALRKFKYKFRNFHLKNSFLLFKKKQNSQNLLKLNRDICESLYKFLGCEQVELKILSTQLKFLPVFKFYKKFLTKELASLQRNREISKYFFEIQESLFFALGTFGSGNARLLTKLLIFLLENIKKQTIIIKLLKKSLNLYFKEIESTFLAVNGIRILIKGRFNKRRRTKKVVLQQGQVSLQTLNVPIDYYQSQAITIYGSFGIKVWLSKKL